MAKTARLWSLIGWCACYLGAAVAANLLIGRLGPRWLWLTALLVIPFDLTARDVLHERWYGNALWRRMAALIMAGAMLSWLAGAKAVAAASGTAFFTSALADTALYEWLRRAGWQVRSRMIGSNLLVASIDTAVFLIAAFGLAALKHWPSQVALKLIGGTAWAWVIGGWRQHVALEERV